MAAPEAVGGRGRGLLRVAPVGDDPLRDALAARSPGALLALLLILILLLRVIFQIWLLNNCKCVLLKAKKFDRLNNVLAASD